MEVFNKMMFHCEGLKNLFSLKQTINSLNEIYIWGAYDKSNEILDSIRKIGGYRCRWIY